VIEKLNDFHCGIDSVTAIGKTSKLTSLAGFLMPCLVSVFSNKVLRNRCQVTYGERMQNQSFSRRRVDNRS